MSARGDLVIAVVRGVQEFIAQSRRTADLRAASAIMSRLCRSMLAAVPDDGHVLFPTAPGEQRADPAEGLPNRMVVLVAEGTGAQVGAAVVDAVTREWAGLVRTHAGGSAGTAGWPVVQWVSVPPGDDGLSGQFGRARDASDGRKRIHGFPGYTAPGQQVCTMTGRWAVSPTSARRRTDRAGEALSTLARVKREFGRGQPFPSTWSVSVAPYLADLLDHARRGDRQVTECLARLRDAVTAVSPEDGRISRGPARIPGLVAPPGEGALAWVAGAEGGWFVPDYWDPASLRRDGRVAAGADDRAFVRGRQAAAALAGRAGDLGVAGPGAYLAVIAQDADHLGRKLTGIAGATPESYQRISGALVEAGRAQRAALEDPAVLGRAVYVGGDDLLGLVPVRTALPAAAAVGAAFTEWFAVPALPGATASVAVLFFHVAYPLQSAVAGVQALLAEAKDRAERPGLGLAAVRRGGERARVVLPAAVPDQPDRLVVPELVGLVASLRGRLSGRLASSLERDGAALATLPPLWQDREVRRLIGRHSGESDGGAGTDRAGAAPPLTGTRLLTPSLWSTRLGDQVVARLAQVARFVAQEGR